MKKISKGVGVGVLAYLILSGIQYKSKPISNAMQTNDYALVAFVR